MTGNTPQPSLTWDAAQDKPFETSYYNAGVHRAALTAPEFFHKGLD